MEKPQDTAAGSKGGLGEVEVIAAGQGGVVSRKQAYAAGMTRAEVRAQVRARRWQRVWSRSLCLHTGEVSDLGKWHAAVFEGGDRAMLDGETSLIASGLTGYESAVIRVSVPRGVRAVRARGLDVRRTRRWCSQDLAPSGVRRTRVEVAAVRGALWAVSDKQAALIITMAVQQGLTTAEKVGAALVAVRRDRRRALLHGLVLDLIGGVRSIGELEFAQECRRRGLPEPTRQSVRKGRNGRYYLDIEWADFGVVVEIDGIHHQAAAAVVDDALRHNEIALEGATVLRLPLLGWRVAREDFMGQVERALRDAGWVAPAA